MALVGSLRQQLRRKRLAALVRRLAAWLPSPAVCVVLYFGTAVCFFRLQEEWSYNDCLYFTVAVLTTVGYGDMAPQTFGGRAMTCVLAVLGCAFIAQTANSGIMDFTQGLLLRLERAASPMGSKAPITRTQARLGSLLCLFTALIGLIMFIGRHMLSLDSWHDCFYFSVVTVTTVGFGDMVPSEPTHRLWMSLLMMVGVPVFAASLGSVVEALSSPADDKEDTVSEAAPSNSSKALAEFRARLHRGAAPPPDVQREDYLAFSLVQKGIVKMEDIWEAWDGFRQLSNAQVMRA